MELPLEKRGKLREPMPPEAIQQHPTKTFLSTIKAIYITERLNDVFGICGWDFEHEIISDEPDYVTIRGRIIILDSGEAALYPKTPFQYGGHKKTGKNTEPADGYKSAVTDCISKCASYLEIGIDVFKGLHGKGGKAPKRQPKAAPKKAPERAQPRREPDETLITRPQQNKLFAMMTDGGYDKKESKELYDWHLSKIDEANMGKPTKDWGTNFIKKFDDIARDFVDHKIDSGEEIDA